MAQIPINPISEAANLRNTAYSIRDSISRAKSAPTDFAQRRNRTNNLREHSSNLSAELDCKNKDTPHFNSCRLIDSADVELASVQRGLDKVRNPQGRSERLRNGFRRGNRRDDQRLDRAGKLLDEAEKSANSRSNLSLSQPSTRSTPSMPPSRFGPGGPGPSRAPSTPSTYSRPSLPDTSRPSLPDPSPSAADVAAFVTTTLITSLFR